MESFRYNRLNTYLKKKFGTRTLKICVDGGFTCPNRDGTKGVGGCIFCNECGAGERIKGKTAKSLQSIENQINSFLESYRGQRAEKYIVYFQAFSGTYDSVQNLQKKYNLALSLSSMIVGLQIATRPDLINKEIVELLKSFKDKFYVCVELGLQTANDKIGDIINRKYSTKDFELACQLLNNAGIDIVAHMMVGLPNETEKDILDTVQVINTCKCSGIKIHSTYVLKNTKLCEMFENGQYIPITQDYYIESVCKVISKLSKNIIIHRLTGDPPKESLIAPLWTTHKKIVLNNINQALKEKNIYQGINFKEN